MPTRQGPSVPYSIRGLKGEADAYSFSGAGDNMRATVRCRCNWLDLPRFIAEALGYSYVSGGALNRWLPMKHPLSAVTPAPNEYPFYELFAQSIQSVRGLGMGSAASGSGGGSPIPSHPTEGWRASDDGLALLPAFTFAEVVLEFGIRRDWILSDSDIAGKPAGEFNRYVTVTSRGASRQLSYFHGGTLQFVKEDGSPGDVVPTNPGRPTSTVSYIWTWKQIPVGYFKEQNVVECLGTVCQKDIDHDFDANGLSHFKKETLLFTGYNITPTVMANGLDAIDLELQIERIAVGTNQAGGWNQLLDSKANPPKYRYVSVGGAAHPSNGYADEISLFRCRDWLAKIFNLA